MSQIGIKPEFKKKIFDMEYKCLTKGNDFFSMEEKERIGGDFSQIQNYFLMSQKHVPFVFLNNVRGDFNDDFFKYFDEIADWFNSRSSIFSVALIPAYTTIPFINELFTKGFVLSSYICYWYKLLDGESLSSFDNNNIFEVYKDLADSFADTSTKGFEIDPKDPIYDYFYYIFKIGCKSPYCKNFLYKSGDKFVGAGSVMLEDDFTFLANGSVIPDYRGQHIQQELVRHRLNYAKSKGANHAIVTTGLDSTSGRNMERLGFQLAFTAEYFTFNSDKAN